MGKRYKLLGIKYATKTHCTGGFPGGSVAEGLLNAGTSGDVGLIPELGRSLGGGNGNPP